jgi:NAD(P)-dependent dehydrogenase (short-subunit alcohol dehydrogenase family)
LSTFANQVVLITGASRGIGAATAHHFAALGATVIVNYREDRAGAERVVAEIGADAAIASAGGRAVPWQTDVGDTDAAVQMVEAVAAAYGPVRVLVHNASGINRSLFQEVTAAQFDEMINANVRGPFFMSQAVARQMAAAEPLFAGQRGSIVHISTILATLAIRSRTLYIATKGAIEALTRAMALDLAPMGIRVNAISPGLIYTAALQAGITHLGEENFIKHIPLNRFGDPAEIATTIGFLASPAASYITGALIPVDGGLGVVEAGPK